MTDDLLSEISNEVRMLSILWHPNIVLLMGISTKPPNMAIIFENVQKGCLFDVLHVQKQDFDIKSWMRIARDVAKTFEFLHSSGIVHRDLKSYNILLDESFNVKVCDFGLAWFQADLNTGSMQFSGTPAYMAPELFMKKSYSEKVDVFAFGTLLWELSTWEIPYDGWDAGDIKEKVCSEEKLDMPYNINKTVASLITDCRKLDPKKRPSFDYIKGVLDGIIK